MPEGMHTCAFTQLDSETWRRIAGNLTRHDLLRFSHVNRGTRALVMHPSFLCDLLDRACGVDADRTEPFFGTLRQLADWATQVAASHGHDADDDESFAGSDGGGLPQAAVQGAVRRSAAGAHDSPVVNVAVAVGALVNFYSRLVTQNAPAMSVTAGSSMASAPSAGSRAAVIDEALATLQVASRTSGAPAKAGLARRVLARGVEDTGALVLPLAFARIVSGARAIAERREAVVEEEAALLLRAANAGHPTSDPAALEHREAQAQESVGCALRLVEKLVELLPVSAEAATLMGTLPHPTHLLAVLDRIAWHDELAATTMVENADDVHDLNENLQPLLASSWLTNTDNHLKSRGKANKWKKSQTARDAATNPFALSQHMRWCRNAHRCIALHQTGLPAVTTFSLVADHPKARAFFQSLALAAQHRLMERGVKRLAIEDVAPFILDPRAARLEGVSVRDLMRVGELDPDFLEQLSLFEPRTAYDR